MNLAFVCDDTPQHWGSTSGPTYFKRAAGLDSQNETIRKALQTVNPYIDQKVGRNEPCPCGSGKKFKKCHGKA